MSTGKMIGTAPKAAKKGAGRIGTARRRLAKTAGVPVSGIPDDELTPRVRTVVSTLIDEVERLRRDLEQSQQRMAELASMADADPLLGIFNRRAFERELDRAIAYAQRYGTTLSVIYIDLDEFKTINDRYGHAVGDIVLRHVADTVSRNVRRSDIFGRIGGDEFVAALIRTGIDDAGTKAGRLARAIGAGRLKGAGQLPKVRVTTGVAEFADGDTVQSLIERADRAMYTGKRTGRRA